MSTYVPTWGDVLTLKGYAARKYHVLALWKVEGETMVTLNTDVYGNGYGGTVPLSELAGYILTVEGGK